MQYAKWAPGESDADAAAKFIARAYADAKKLGVGAEEPSGASLKSLGG